MANTPRYAGFLDPPYNVTLTDDSGAALDLTGCVSSSFTLTMINSHTGLALSGAGTGVWTVANQTTNKGQVSYQWTTTDMSTAGLWQVYTTVKLPAEPSPREFDPELIEIKAGTVGAGAVPPGVLPNPSATLPFLNIRDFGGIGDNATDNTIPIFNARTAARALGGARILFGPGTFLHRNQDMSQDHGIVFEGSGKGITTLKLMNGSNADLFSAQTNLINLSASGGSSPAGTLYGFGFVNMTLDGNKANQSGGPSYPLRFYGCDYILENVDAINGYSGDILSDWNAGNNWPAGAHSMESRWTNVKTTNSNGIGIEFGGPHDSQFINVIPYQEGTHCLHLGYNAYGSQFSHLHAWSPGQNDGVSFYGQDDFGRSNQSGLGTSSDGQAWTESPASGNVTAAIASNQASFTGNGTEADSFFTLGSTSVANIDIYERLNLGGDSGNNTVGITFRFTDASNWYRAVVSGNLLYLQKKVAGTQSTVTSTAFTLGNNTNAWMRIQASGTTLKAKIWLEGTAEPSSWNITQTDSAFSSGKFGIMAWINSSTATVDSFVATSPITTPLSVAVLNEAQGAVYFENCQAESSRSVQAVILGSGCEWIGGNIFPATPYVATGFQIGQQAGATPYAGQLRQSAGVTNAYNPTNVKIDCRASNNQGPQGAIWFANDGGGSSFDIVIDQGKGNPYVGSYAATSKVGIVPFGITKGALQFPGNAAFTGSVQVAGASKFYSGSGAPNDSTTTVGSANGDFYFRTDTPGSANQRLYVKSAGAWIGII